MSSVAPRMLGPYRILETLGRGGMGVVYRARDESSGTEVAIKTVLLANAGALSGIRREIRALASIHHPGIVRIVSEGTDDGLPWYAMELVAGESLRVFQGTVAGRAETYRGDAPTTAHAPAAGSAWWTEVLAPRPITDELSRRGPGSGKLDRSKLLLSPEALPEAAWGALADVLTVVRRLCAPLGYLHGEGIVHRDLKPENVLVRPDGFPVLVDFGLMSRSGAGESRELLDVAGGVSGTVAYMSPEQARGEIVDARADLYSLGCILYELVTGQPPFVGEGPLQVIRMHEAAEPIPASRLCRGVPAPLEELLARLLAKSPRDRIGHADAVAACLEDLGASPALAPGTPVARPYLYRPRFAGREEPMRPIEDRVRALAARDPAAPGVVLVSGEAGAGKTRFLTELSLRAVRRGVDVLAGECGRAPLSGLTLPLQALADRCRAGGARETARLLGRRARVLAAYEPLLSDLPGVAELPATGELPAGAARERLFTYLGDVWAALALDRPSVLILDDLQDGDELTAGFVEHVRRMLLKSPVPLCLVAACKAGEETGAIAALRGAEGVTTLPLPRLAKRDVAAIASDMLAVSPVPAGFARFLARHSEGNAFFLCEYLRTAVDASVVARDARGRWQLDGDAASFEGLPLPRGLRELVSGRIAELDPAALEVLRWAAAIGREMGQALLAGIMGVSEDAIDEPIRKLLGKQLLEERGPLYRFGHEKVREIAYDALAPEIRATIHGRAARIIEALPDAARAAHLADLGRHWERAGEPRRALSPYLAAARAAGRVYALAEAERLYVAYLALAVPATLESVAIRCELAEEVLQLAGRATDALHHHGLAIAEARSLGDPGLEGRGLRGRGIVYWHLGRNAEALSDLRDALALHRAAGDRRRVGLTLASIGNVLHDQGELSDACRIYEDARRIHEEVGDDAGLLAVLGYLAVHAHDLGDLDLAVRRYEECIALARASGKRPIEAATLGNLAVLEFDRGRSERSAELLAAALAIARDVGARRLEGIVLANLANLEIDCGNKERGRALYEEALAIHREVGDLPYEAAALIGIGTHLLDSGRMDDARRTLEEARRLQRDLHDRRSEGSTNVVLARLERLTGKIAVARSLCDDAIAIFRESDDRLGLGKALCEAGHQSLASGTDADRELAEARAIAAALGVGAGSLGAKIERLAAAERASREGRTVVRGEDPATIASGLLQAISG